MDISTHFRTSRLFGHCPSHGTGYSSGMNTTMPLLTPREAGEILRLTSREVNRLARQGVLPVVVLPGGEFRFSAEDLVAWIDQHRRQQARILE